MIKHRERGRFAEADGLNITCDRGDDGDRLSGLILLAARLNCLAGSEEAGSAAATNAARRRWFESDTGGIRERLSLRSR
jgi:hypothetical protein